MHTHYAHTHAYIHVYTHAPMHTHTRTHPHKNKTETCGRYFQYSSKMSNSWREGREERKNTSPAMERRGGTTLSLTSDGPQFILIGQVKVKAWEGNET